MKTSVYLLLIVLSAIRAFGQAQLGPHQWTATVRVVDESGQPVESAKTWIAYDNPKDGQSTDPFQSNNWAIAGLTDNNGIFSASHSDASWSLGFRVQKPEFYTTYISYGLYVPGQFDSQTVAANRNPKLTLMLKKIGKPIPMYAKWIDSNPPVLSQPVGYDLTVGDWVAPYGGGKMTDIIFNKEAHRESGVDYDYKVTVSFPNAGDGIQQFSVPESAKGSELRSPHEAPVDGYNKPLVKERYAHPGQASKSNYDENANYFFRVRTAFDEQGNVKSALYGKIYGEFMQFRYYLNPTPNDRNMEFDTKHNLLNQLRSVQRVMAP